MIRKYVYSVLAEFMRCPFHFHTEEVMNDPDWRADLCRS